MRRIAMSLTLLVLVVACGSAGQDPGWQTGSAPPAGGASSEAPAVGGSGGPSVIPVIISQYDVGPARFVFSFLDSDGNLPVAAPDRVAQVAFIPPGGTEPGAAVPAEFAWAIQDTRGEYIAHTEFPAAGTWKAVFITSAPDSPQEAIGVTFDVLDQLPTIDIGEPAPASDTLTAADVGGDLSKLSTDPDPDPEMYQLSVADAVDQHRPFVLIFATPAFCQSAQCGPTLDELKAMAAKAPDDIVFINVEPYQLAWTDGRLQPVLDADNQLQPVPAVDQWGILSEPWVFAVDGQGIVRGSFEGVATEKELTEVFAEISGT
jgi:hypothetical protein